MKLRILAGLLAVFGTSGALLAQGECTVEVDDGVLVIEGDDGDNAVVVTETPGAGSGVFLVIGEGGTLINGLESETFGGRIEDIEIDLGDGVNSVEVSGVELSGDLAVCGGEGFNEFKLEESAVGGSVEIENEEGGSEISIEASLIGGDVAVENDDGFDEFGIEASLVEGDVDVDNGDGNELDEGSNTGFDDGTLVGGDVTILNDDGFDEFDLEEESEILGDLTIRNNGGGSGIDIELSTIGEDLLINARSGFDEVNLDDTSVGGDADIRLKSGGSDVQTESSTGEGNVSIAGSLYLEANGTVTDNVLFDVLDVGDDVEIHLGPGDDFITVLNCVFQGDFDVDGHSGIDTFTDGGGNTLLEDSELENLEIILP
ncbi:MAG: hypothetical protein L0323_17465 [Planctomycetes bacterium]|nr:hypothetical protein [Planctomycetota bacterium]